MSGNRNNPVGWFEIYVQDMERAKNFYQRTLELELQPLQSPESVPGLELLAFPMNFEKPGCTGALVRMEGKDSGIGGSLVYFSCNDCAVEAARAVENGGTLFKPKTSIGQYGFYVLIKDTEGNLIGLHSMQ